MIDKETERDRLQRKLLKDIFNNASTKVLLQYSDDMFEEMEKRKAISQAILYLDRREVK